MKKNISIAVLLIAVIAVSGLSYVYAEQQATVTLPLDRPYFAHECKVWNMITLSEEGIVRYACLWDWNIDQTVFKELEKIFIDKGADYEAWLEEVIPLIEKNQLKEVPEDEVGTGIPVIPEELDVVPEGEEEKFLSDFEKCFGGLEQSYAFQMEYEFEKFFRKYLRHLDSRDKLAEECIAIGHILELSNASYPGKVVREDTSVKTSSNELVMSKNAKVTEDKLKTEADVDYPPWYQNPYADWSGTNRGNSAPILDGESVVNIPDTKNTGKNSKQILAEYHREKAASIITAEDIKRFNDELFSIVCTTAWKTSGYGGLAIVKWRIFLAEGDCDESLPRELIPKGFNSFEEFREYKIEQGKTDVRPDLRQFK